MLKPIITALLLCASLQAQSAPKVLATVNGQAITQAQIENFMAHNQTPLSYRDALAEIITIELLAEKRLTQGILPDTKLYLELDRQRKAVIASDMLQQILKSFTISDETIESEYKKTYTSLSALTEYNARHILVDSETQAKELITELSNGADFAALAKVHSSGPSGKNGGSLGWFDSSRMVKPFSDATAALKKGAFTMTPVNTDFGWHIIKLDDTRINQAPTLESVKKEIINRLSTLELSKALNELRKTAVIEVK
ncbi:MAG: peptidylprolyl isomerase [Gammaproteobacteria bacterium]|nr:peptidylprolyl isomerase [Gammaproteobacteria bacterium]